MTGLGIVQDKTIILDEGIIFPQGARVTVHLMPEQKPKDPTDDQRKAALKDLLGLNLPVGDWAAMEEEIIRGAID